MTGKDARAWISGHRWPLYLAGILLMSIVAQSTLVYFATRPSAPRPIADYYRKSMDWDADRAVVEASRQLGWVVTMDVPDLPHDADTPRPVDVTIRDREALPVTGLTGDLVVLRPADGRLNTRGRLVELPHEPGRYRTLVALPAPGLWEMNVDATRGDLRFVHQARVTVAAGAM
jgi:nitrogen fixation protein FixH